MNEHVVFEYQKLHILLVNYVCAVRVYNLVRKFAYGGCSIVGRSGSERSRVPRYIAEGMPKFIPPGGRVPRYVPTANTDHHGKRKTVASHFGIPQLYHCFPSKNESCGCNCIP